MANPAKNTTDTKLSLDYVLQELEKDGVISPQQASQVKAIKDHNDNSGHPLSIIADLGLQSNTKPSYPLTLEQLTRWLAKKSRQEYLRIDPLKIDVARVTGVVSQAYANKIKILPVFVNDTDLSIATCEPYISSWENELERITKRKIKRILINPNDLERYLKEFYGVSRSLRGAVSDSKNKTLSNLQNFEQLIDKRRPQDGRIKTKTPNGNEVEMRLSTMPTAFGEKLVLRIFDPDMLMKDYVDLGFSDYDMQHWNTMLEQPHGIILVTGPTGSGKTTTLYST